jgi:hypothetical protein
MGLKLGLMQLNNGIVVSNCDETRYACASRPWTKPVPKTDGPLRGIESMSINQLWAKQPKTGNRI